MVSLYYRKMCKSLLSLEGTMQWKTPIYYNSKVRGFCSPYLIIIRQIIFYIDLPLSHSEDIFFNIFEVQMLNLKNGNDTTHIRFLF